ncbi:MAG: inorganic phosphate transporter [Candidatus Omnitrophica bacterium]|nr:inorganic phosphate transporter [Candidatus Omnitrophota bacterium]
MILILLTLLAGGFIGWSIGANDAANCVGVGIGSRKMTLKQATVLICVFSFLGAIMLGHRVIKTVGKGIVPLDKIDPNFAMAIALAACFGAGLWVLSATYFKLPVSTSHSTVGAVAGAGLALGTVIVWRKLFDIFICWLLTPIGAALLAFLLYHPIRRLFYVLVPRRLSEPLLTVLIFGGSIYLAFTWGANDVANVTGVIVGSGTINLTTAMIIGAIAIIIGITTWGKRVIETVGFNITNLVPLAAVVVNLASALNIHIYTMMGIPVSTSHSVVGAIFGVGLVRGVKAIQKQVVRDIILAWTLTPFAAGFLSFLIIKCLMFMKIV